jgi:hypothetical protein
VIVLLLEVFLVVSLGSDVFNVLLVVSYLLLQLYYSLVIFLFESVNLFVQLIDLFLLAVNDGHVLFLAGLQFLLQLTALLLKLDHQRLHVVKIV